MTRPRLAPTHVVWALVSALACPAVCAEDLLDVFRDALRNDPVYLSAGAANRAAQEFRPQALAPLLPAASANANTFANAQDVRSAGSGTGFSHFNSTSFTLSLTQPVFRKDLLIELGRADSRIQQANAEYAAALQDLIFRVGELYFGVLSAEDDLEFELAQRDANEQQLKQSQQRFDVGLIAITDVEEAKAGFDLASARVIEAENARDNALEALRELIGRYLTVLTPLGENLPLIAPEPNNLEEWTRTAASQNLRLIAAQHAADAAFEAIKVREAEHLPTLDLVAEHNVTQTGGRFGTSDIVNSAIGFEINVPIYEGGLVLSRTREARQLHQQALDDLEREKRIAQRQARDGFRGVISGISEVDALAQAVVSTQSALNAIEAGFQVGTRTSVDVLEAQSALFGAKRDYAQARYDYIIDILRLKQAAGTLSEQDLAEVNRWLQ